MMGARMPATTHRYAAAGAPLSAGAHERPRGARVRLDASARPRASCSARPCAGRGPRACSAPLRAARARRWPAGLRALGLETVGDLLEHLPSDSREARTVAALRAGEQATVAVQVRAIAARPVRRRGMRPLVEATVFDATGTMRATFFNQPWLVERYPPGTRLLLHGKADGRGGFRVSHHALGAGRRQRAADGPGEGDAVAHYPAAEGVTSTQILTLVQRRARRARRRRRGAARRPRACASGCPTAPSALAAMHFPRGRGDAEAGRRRLAFEELLLTQLVFLRRRARAGAARGAPRARPSEPALSARWLARGLPFALTGDQRAAIEAIAADLARAAPMQRLLMGEVGSGKTVVALYAMLRAVEHGHQAALMAPTETLAEQHFATIQRLLGAEPVTRGAARPARRPARRRADILGKLASGELSLVVGTHALIEPDVRFARARGGRDRRAAPLRRAPARGAARRGDPAGARAAHRCT